MSKNAITYINQAYISPGEINIAISLPAFCKDDPINQYGKKVTVCMNMGHCYLLLGFSSLRSIDIKCNIIDDDRLVNDQTHVLFCEA